MDNNFDERGRNQGGCGDFNRRPPNEQFGGLPQNWPARQGIVFAIIIIIFGVLLFLDNIGIYAIRDVWQYWPLIFVAVGFQHMVNAQQWAGRVWGGLLVTIGVLWVCRNMGILPWGFGAIVAVFVMGFGFMLLVQNVEQRGGIPLPEPAGKKEEDLATKDFSTADSVLKEWVVFSGVDRRFDARGFRGGELLAIFGGIVIDLRRAIPDTSQNMVLDTVAVFGGIELRVPETWRIVVRGVAVFGAYENKTIPPVPSAGASVPTLVITGSAVFGGVSVKQ
jgi:predicted membrane protein